MAGVEGRSQVGDQPRAQQLAQRLLRDGDLEEIGPLVIAAARAFLVGG
jgi:hypothetical protein